MKPRRHTPPPAPGVDTVHALYTRDRIGEALTLIARLTARKGHPDNPTLHNLAGACHVRLGDPVRAEASYRRALRLKPEHADFLNNLGNILKLQKRFPEAEEAYRMALRHHPGHTEARNNLGVFLKERKRFAEAEAAYREVLRLQPDHAGTWWLLGNLLGDLQRHTEAEDCYRQALIFRPDHVEVHNHLGLLLTRLGRLSEAEAVLRQALRSQPGHVGVCNNLGFNYFLRKEDDLAEAAFREALRGQPDFAPAHRNLGVLLKERHRFAEAETALRMALKHQPDYADAQGALGLLYLAMGRFSEGWPLFEARFHPECDARDSIPLQADFPMWRGEVLTGKSLLLIPEQGYGDQIQFCRFYSILKSKGLSRLTLIAQPALAALLRGLTGVDQVIEPDPAGRYPSHDYWAFPLSLPYRLQTTEESIPATLPYLRAPEERLSRWRHLPQTRPGWRVGLAWKGSPIHRNDANRSLPGLAVLAPLWSVPGMAFVSLQKGSGEEEGKNPPPDQPLLHLGGEIRDFADTAAMVTRMDLVITIDSALAHLAGALGKPCWVLLPARGVDWRWMFQRSDSPWYPGVMRLFRQTQPDDWSEVVEQVRVALTRLRV
ncbi:MAG: tetratricopeptide repeat protein [Magnetococcales bacterium]|nr:tetratricopeptide repeat protein [Magnetococcales bacterium]